MKKVFFIVSAALVTLAASAYTIQAIINWKILSDKSQVKFKLDAHGQELIGSFTGAKGDIQFDGSDLGKSTFNCSIDVATINTGMEQRNGHLQAKGWFNAAEFPTINFTSSKIEKTAEGYNAMGKLSLKGVTKDVTIPFTFENPTDLAGTFKGSFTIKRGDFGVGKTDGDIGNDVTIMLEIPVASEKTK
jgi:polyisoprenoid-binding protein YceI